MSLTRKIAWKKTSREWNTLLTREWLVTNGLGGYASGTIGGVATRRYHAILIAALPSPFGRRVMLNHISEKIKFPDGSLIKIGSEEQAMGGLILPGAEYLTEFRLEDGLPVWRYKVNDLVFDKRILMPNMQNTVFISYRHISGKGPYRIELRPSFHFRPHDSPVDSVEEGEYYLTSYGSRYEIYLNNKYPHLRLKIYGEEAALTLLGGKVREIYYRSEAERGYQSYGKMWSPGYFRAELVAGRDVTLVASTENWENILALQPDEALSAERRRKEQLFLRAHPAAKKGTAAELLLAADQFIFTPAGRVEDSVRMSAAGTTLKSVIAGYHWFTDWGRDTMISLEGLTLMTGREREAHWILLSFAHYIKYGLIPNLFPEGEKEGLYHTADATMWFFHAVDRYVTSTGDKAMLAELMPSLKEVIECHLHGTRFGIHVDPKDGLLSQGEEGYQLTWMDAKVDDWVVTPRRGKAVEINALWYNTLMLMSEWVKETEGEEAAQYYLDHAEKCRSSFNSRFWYDEGKYLYDVVDTEKGEDDAALRPNQVFAISLKYPVLQQDKWETVLNTVRKELLTPVGLRSLSRNHPDYKEKYFGNLRARDAAYHQGTVWGWLIGPFIDAWLKVYPGKKSEARKFLEGFTAHLDEACIGSVSEIFDAEYPYTPRGCIAQAWSVAEVLRCLVKTAEVKEE